VTFGNYLPFSTLILLKGELWTELRMDDAHLPLVELSTVVELVSLLVRYFARLDAANENEW